MAIVLLIKHPIFNREFNLELDIGESCTLGRGEDCSFEIEDNKVSERHCKITKEKLSFKVRDLSSKNGVFINGVKTLEGSFYIGDILKIGNTVITIDETKLTDLEALYFRSPEA